MTDLVGFVLLFCRYVLAFAFAFSLCTKVLSFHSFSSTVANFRLFSTRIIPVIVVIILALEGLISLSLFIGEELLNVGFIVAQFTLITFTTVVFITYKRKIKTNCNCFGSDNTPLNSLYFLRNFAFLGCAVAGWIIHRSQPISDNFSLIETTQSAVIAVVFVLLLIYLKEITFLGKHS